LYELSEWHYTLAATLGNFADLAMKPWSSIRHIEIFPGCRLDARMYVLPERWLPAGISRRASNRTIDPADAGVPGDSVQATNRDENVRRILLTLWLPHMSLTGVRQFKPRSWLGAARLFLELAAWQLTHRPSQDGSILSGLKLEDILTGLFPSIARSRRKRDNIQSLLRKLIDAGQRGVISDWPRVFASPATPGSGRGLEKSRKDAPRSAHSPNKEKRNWQPFSDQFVTELIRRALWVQTHLATPLLQCWRGLRVITDAEARKGRTSSNPATIAAREEYLRAFEWRTPEGQKIVSLPFRLRRRNNGQLATWCSWPPGNARSVNRLVNTLQALNVCMLAFCTGARSSEIAAAEDQELGKSSDHFRSLTFKLADEFSGKPRDWPLHPAAVRALAVQHELASIVRPNGLKHLWVISKTREHLGQPLLNLTEPLVNAVEHLELSHLAGADRAHLHRWRHTVARLVALSVIGAPQVLLDLFGHRDLDMTLRYMLSDPAIVEDAMKVAKETAFATAEEAIAETIRGDAGGPAAPVLRKGLDEAMRRGEEAFDTRTLRETAEMLTFNGRYWMLVRPGVLCTKGLGEYGPCTRERGAPDSGSCRTACTHRLELARAKKDCEDALRALLHERDEACADNAEMLLANLDGQILSQLARWDEVRARIISEFPAARTIWKGARS